jgi:hypothetical protein
VFEDTPALAGISIVPLPEGDYLVAVVDEDGTVAVARRASRNKLAQLFGYIGDALEPGLLASLGLTSPYYP